MRSYLRNMARVSARSIRKNAKLIVGGAAVVVGSAVQAGTDATVITGSASTAFTDIATLCVAIGTFFVVYRLVKKIK
jgi:hypothetical protein